jgi:glycosyltransferase involved in cell wall biosynthesis
MSSPINVLHLSTHNEECGIAIFQQNIVDGMGAEHAINNVFFDISPNKLKLLKGIDFANAVRQLATQLKEFDMLHIQHEYSFYYDAQLLEIVRAAKATGKKILFTMHTPPHALGKHLPIATRPGLHPRSWVHAYRTKKQRRAFLLGHIEPLKLADLLIVTSEAAKGSFASFGVPLERMRLIELPVPAIDATKSSHTISSALHKTEGDVLLSTVGFIAEAKGVVAAVKSLIYLPKQYKLAIIGGAHPSGQNDKFYDKVCDLINELGLRDRVYIAGYVADDAVRDALVRETDICLYPYDRDYYNYVSSAALTNAVANSMPVVAYKTDTFLEANGAVPFISFCHSANYYELARVVQGVDITKSTELTGQYAKAFSVQKQSARFADVYRTLIEP